MGTHRYSSSIRFHRPAQIAKEEERKRLEVLAYERQLEAKREQKRQFALRILMLRDTYKILDGKSAKQYG